MYELNQKIIDLVPYEPISGDYKIRLDANECPFNLPQEISVQIAEAVKNISFNRYPDPLSTGLIGAFAGFYGIKPENITAGNGSDELIFLVESAFLEKGDKMLVVSPDFSMYNFYSSICEVECETFFKDENLKIDVDALIDKVNTENIKLVIFSNPCNPTGSGITASQAEKLVSSVNSLVVLDEAYMDFWSESLIDKAEKYDNLIVFRTASKMVGSAALRLGFAVANKKITNGLRAVKSPYNVNSVSQAIGEIVYNNKDHLIKRKEIIVKNTKRLYNSLVDISSKVSGFKPYETCANFVFVKAERGSELFEFLKARSIVVRLMGDYLRITAGTEAEIDELLCGIKEFFNIQ